VTTARKKDPNDRTNWLRTLRMDGVWLHARVLCVLCVWCVCDDEAPFDARAGVGRGRLYAAGSGVGGTK
jgi:hypothetical protein